MIVKVQLSLATSHPFRQMLVYNEDRSFSWEGAASKAVVEAVGDGGDITGCKQFFHAHINEDGVIMLDGEAPWQDW